MRHWHKRVEVGSFFDLSEADQAAEWRDDDNAEELAFLIAKDGEYWNLDSFMRTERGRYDGVMTVTNTSAIGVVLSRDGESAVVQCFT
jgi:hypothetical protein